MRILIDTHILLWHIEDNKRLPKEWSLLLENQANLKMVSMVSLWEIAIKTNINKLSISYPLDKIVPIEFQILDIKMPHLLAYQELPQHHKDPFDRLLIVQAQLENLEVMTLDENFPLYNITLIK